MSFDRGFIKWQPFNSVVPSKALLSNASNKKEEKPTLFPEKLDILNEQIKEAYYSNSTIYLTYYEKNSLKTIETTIIQINPDMHTLKLENNKTIAFSQIISIT